MWSDFSPCSLVTNDGQQLSTHALVLEATASVLVEEPQQLASSTDFAEVDSLVFIV
jgi:hypothetical protein